MKQQNNTKPADVAIQPSTEAVAVEETPVSAVVEAEQPKQAAPVVEPQPMKTPRAARRYQLIKQPSIPPKGKQRIITLEAISQDANKAWSVDEVAKYADSKHYYAAAGTKASVEWHLHQLELLGCVKVVNPLS